MLSSKTASACLLSIATWVPKVTRTAARDRWTWAVRKPDTDNDSDNDSPDNNTEYGCRYRWPTQLAGGFTISSLGGLSNNWKNKQSNCSRWSNSMSDSKYTVWYWNRLDKHSSWLYNGLDTLNIESNIFFFKSVLNDSFSFWRIPLFGLCFFFKKKNSRQLLKIPCIGI